MGSSRNRNAGHKLERDCAAIQREIGYADVKTSRECSRDRDNKKVDLINSDEDLSGRLPYNFQCKTLCATAPYPKLLAELETYNGRRQINVALHQMTKKKAMANGKSRFEVTGNYAILNADDFYRMEEKILKLEQMLVQQRPEDLGSEYITKELIEGRINKQL